MYQACNKPSACTRDGEPWAMVNRWASTGEANRCGRARLPDSDGLRGGSAQRPLRRTGGADKAHLQWHRRRGLRRRALPVLVPRALVLACHSGSPWCSGALRSAGPRSTYWRKSDGATVPRPMVTRPFSAYVARCELRLSSETRANWASHIGQWRQGRNAAVGRASVGSVQTTIVA